MIETIEQWTSTSTAAWSQQDGQAGGDRLQQAEESSRSGLVIQNLGSIDSNPPSLAESTVEDDMLSRVLALAPLLEDRLRLVCAPKKQSRGRNPRRGRSKQEDGADSDSADSMNEFLNVQPDPILESESKDGIGSIRESFSEEGLASVSSSSSTGHAVARSAEPAMGRRLDAAEDDFDDESWF
jgi:hypothetical protein